MKKIHYLILVLVVIVVAAVMVISSKQAKNNDTNKVAATIFPIYDIARNIAGDYIDIVVILPSGASPHTFDLTPKQAKELSKSRAVFAVGQGLDGWVSNLADNETKIITLDKNITLREFDETEHEAGHEDEHEEEFDNHDSEEGGHHHEGVDPHYWLSVRNATMIAEQIKTELSLLYPQHTSHFQENYDLYSEKLHDLDREIESSLSQVSSRNIATFHNAWGYYANDYNLNIVATFEEFPGEEPTIQYLTEFQEKVEHNAITAIFSEPQFSTKMLDAIANDLNVKISTLDPIGGVEKRDTYINLMRYNTDQVIATLQ
ncbi:zinc ABC transporter substrate-binding protein [Candidatus Woesebacteria bacterium]|nr:MAG: zinc ABC transporter substrate-binding protein [Candidatus Woesebacteria bacterium]